MEGREVYTDRSKPFDLLTSVKGRKPSENQLSEEITGISSWLVNTLTIFLIYYPFQFKTLASLRFICSSYLLLERSL